jgi:hypothetical protein
MKNLLDHNTPLGVRRVLANHDVQPAGQMGWETLSNTNLLDAGRHAELRLRLVAVESLSADRKRDPRPRRRGH